MRAGRFDVVPVRQTSLNTRPQYARLEIPPLV